MVKRKIIIINEDKCDGCGNCITSCPEQAIQIIDTKDGPKARLVKDFYCDGLGVCMGSCPIGALAMEERITEPYDDEATVKRIKEVAPDMLAMHIKHMKDYSGVEHEKEMHSCPGSRMLDWGDKTESDEVGKTESIVKQKSELRHWPIQLSLINPAAPYFQDADLLVAADCVPFSYVNFHLDFLKGKSLIIACPKLDDVDVYREKLVELFKTVKIKSITVVNMEVPCCFGLQNLVKEAMQVSGKKIPYCDVTISIKGEVL